MTSAHQGGGSSRKHAGTADGRSTLQVTVIDTTSESTVSQVAIVHSLYHTMARMTCPTALVCFLLFYCPCLAFDGTEWWNHGADWSSSWSFRGGAGRASSSRRRRPQKSQRERQAARPRQQSSRSSPTTSIRGTKRSSNGSADTLQSALQAHASRDSVQTTPRRRACGLYIWDAPSALLYRWCNHLMKDCVYEGKGGKKVCAIRSIVLGQRGSRVDSSDIR